MTAHASPALRSHSPAPLQNGTTNPSNSTTPRLTVEYLLNLINDKAEYIAFSVDHENFEQSSLDLLKIVFPEWFVTGSKHLKLTQCTEGITNKLMKCKNLATGQVVLIRAYGKKSELIIDRQSELITFATLQEDGLAPTLHCRFENGFIYGYVPGIPLKHAELSFPEYFPLIARKIAHWHQVDNVPGDRSPRVFRTLWKWLKNIPEIYSRPEVQAKFVESIDIVYLKNELESLEFRAKSLDCPVVFCHNDLLCANIIYNPESKDVSFIDYEYGSFNYRSFDIANHFCEFGGFDCDYSLYPSESFQRQWIKEYLSSFSGTQCTENEINQVLKEVAIFNLVAHSFWCIWGLVQAQVSSIEFDYMAYAAKRFNEFKRRRAIL